MTEAVLEEQVELLLNEALHHHSAGRRNTLPHRSTMREDAELRSVLSDRPALAADTTQS